MSIRLWLRFFRGSFKPLANLSDFLGRPGTRHLSRPVEPGMKRLIEEYLRTRGVRYFRGHHDEEYFYLLGVGDRRGRLNVHLEISGPDRDTVLIGITADRYYPAGLRETLDGLVVRWNSGASAIRAEVHDSSDPRLVGVSVRGEARPDSAAGLAGFVDAAVGSSVELFEAMPGVPGGRQVHGILRDAG